MDIIKAIEERSDKLTYERDKHTVFGKLAEETGEVAKAIYQPERCDEPVSGELADVIITAVDLHRKIYGEKSHSLLCQDIVNKLDKWERKYGGGKPDQTKEEVTGTWGEALFGFKKKDVEVVEPEELPSWIKQMISPDGTTVKIPTSLISGIKAILKPIE